MRPHSGFLCFQQEKVLNTEHTEHTEISFSLSSSAKAEAPAGKPGAPSLEIDDASPENLKALQRFAESIIEEKKQQFDELCHLLAGNRDRKEEQKDKKSLRRRIQYYVNKISGRAGA
jgi:hypothetical protein